MSRLRVGLVGGGHLGRIHARLLMSLAEVEVVAVAESHAETRHELTCQLGIPCCSTVEQLPENLDAAVVAVPTRYHADVAGFLLDRGIHVFVEKPLASSSFDANRLTRLAAQKKCILQVGHVEAFNPAVAQLPTDLFPAAWISSVRQSPYSFRSTDISVIMDLMIHDIDLVLQWQQSPVKQVEASGYRALSDQVDTVQARVYFANGGVAQFFASRVSPHRERVTDIFSRTGSARIDFATGRNWVTRPGRPWTGSSLEPAARPAWQERLFTDLLPTEEFHPPQCNPIRNELEEFVANIHTGRSPRVDGRRATQAIEVAELIGDALVPIEWNQPPREIRKAA